MTVRGADVLAQLEVAGLIDHLRRVEVETKSLSGEAHLSLIAALRDHPAFKEGWLHGLHPDVGHDRRDFRAHRGSFGVGSLQIVVDAVTGRFYCDLDEASPYSDVVGFLWHSGEVIGHRLRRLFRRRRHA